MTSRTTARFRKAFASLPSHVRTRAKVAYHQFQANPHHPGLHFKRIHTTREIYSVRVGLGYRALGVRDGDVMIWFWIGTHAGYNQLLASL